MLMLLCVQVVQTNNMPMHVVEGKKKKETTFYCKQAKDM
jgi:hypothetical protein